MGNNNTPSKQGYFKTLRLGEYGLAKTYWLHFITINIIISIIISIIGLIIQALNIHNIYNTPIPIISLLIISFWLFNVSIGLWNASNKYKGFQLWAYLVKIIAFMNFLQLILGGLIAIIDGTTRLWNNTP